MSFHEDLVVLPAEDSGVLEPLVAIGWLAKAREFPVAVPSNELLHALNAGAVLARANQTRGFHYCEFCDVEDHRVEFRGRRVLLGSAEIQIVSPDGVIFCAPDLLVHYVREHHYCPPGTFQEAVIAWWRKRATEEA